jgi:hypothetical protein
MMMKNSIFMQTSNEKVSTRERERESKENSANKCVSIKSERCQQFDEEAEEREKGRKRSFFDVHAELLNYSR